MLRKTIAIFVIVFASNMSQSHDILHRLDCEPHTTITAGTVRDIRICPAEPDGALEIRWRNIESSLVTLHYGNKKVTSKLFLGIWKISDNGTKARSLGGDESFSQLELLSDTIIDGDSSPDGTLLIATDSCSQIRAWDLTRDAEIYIPQLDYSNDGFPGMAALFHPDGRFLAVAEKALLGLLYVHADE